MATASFMHRGFGLFLILVLLLAAQSHTTPLFSSDVSSSTDLVSRSGAVHETGLAPYSALDNRAVAFPQYQMSSEKLTLLGYVYANAAALAGAACLLGQPEVCLTILCVSTLTSLLAFFLVDGKKKATVSGSHKSLIEPGDHHYFNVGEGSYELDDFLFRDFAGNDSVRDHVKTYLDDLRNMPQHVFELEHDLNGNKHATAHLPGEDPHSNDADEDPADKKVKITKATLTFKGGEKGPFFKLGKKKKRDSDVKPLAKGLAKFIAKHLHKGTCVDLYDKASPNPHKEIYVSTFYINGGNGQPVNPACY